MSNELPAFNPYEYLNRIQDLLEGEEVSNEPVLLSNEYRASDIGTMMKTALRAIELMAEKIGDADRK